MFNFLKTPTFGQTYTCVCNGQSSIIAQLYWDIIFEPLDFELVTISIRFALHHCWLFFLHRLQFGIDDNVWIALWKLCKDKEERGEILALRFIEQWYTDNNFVHTHFYTKSANPIFWCEFTFQYVQSFTFSFRKYQKPSVYDISSTNECSVARKNK